MNKKHCFHGAWLFPGSILWVFHIHLDTPTCVINIQLKIKNRNPILVIKMNIYFNFNGLKTIIRVGTPFALLKLQGMIKTIKQHTKHKQWRLL